MKSSRLSPGLLAALAGLGYLAWSSRSDGAVRPPSTPGGGSTHGRAEVAAGRTGGTDAHAWTRSRYLATVNALAGLGITGNTVRAMAIALVAQWARETGWGRNEWNYNVGNIKAMNWSGDYHRLNDGSFYRSFPTLAEGIANALALHQSSRYRAAWDYLRSSGDAVGWYDRIMRAGYHPWSEEALTDMRSIASRVASEPVSGLIGALDAHELVGWCHCVGAQLGGLA